MRKRMAIHITLAVLVCAVVAGCSHRTASSGAAKHGKPAGFTEKLLPAGGFSSSVSYDKMARENAGVKPAVAPYSVKPDLSNVANKAAFKSLLEPALTKMIAKNLFAVTPTDNIEMFEVYEQNEYARPYRIPAFITTDSMLHFYHIFYDYTLRVVESQKLHDAAVKLTDAMLAASEKDLAAAKAPIIKDAALRNLAYFAVARSLLKGTPPPKAVSAMVSRDLRLIADHAGWGKSRIMGFKIDFSQFVPRGHYTRTEKLKKYFRALMWYGLTPFPVPSEQIGPVPTVQALLIVRNLRSVNAGATSAAALWDTIYEPTAFYVGTADDYTFKDYSKLADKQYGSRLAVNDFADKTRLTLFLADVDKLPGPGIENYGGGDPEIPTGRQFRFMGQRFIPDSRILQELSHPTVFGRDVTGLDPFAAIGSDRALKLAEKTCDSGQLPAYTKQMTRMRGEIKALTLPKWQSNLYYGWIWSLQALVDPLPEGCPIFTQSTAWQEKCLLTGLGSWTELRHDTILYAKQSVTSECGGAEEELKTPKGYVEPNLEFWTRLLWLNSSTKAGLANRGLLSAELRDKFDKMGDWIDFCRNITIKELTNKKVTDDEYNQMTMYGADLAELKISIAGGEVMSDTDQDMAVVADVHTDESTALEEGTGRAANIYVVVPIEGKLYLTRGSVYTQYQFVQPSSNRLTDEQWQQMLKSGKQPPLADWIKDFLVNTKRKHEPQGDQGGGGC